MKLLRIITGNGSASSVASIVCALAVAACSGGTALVSNHVGIVATATTIDANLSNRLGAVTAPGLPFWIADNSGNLAAHYSGTEAIQTKESAGSSAAGIAIPVSAAGVPANPNGEVYNGNGGFLIPTSNGQETALFIFDGEGGTIAAWATHSGAAAVTAYDDGLVNGNNHAVYKGLALGDVNGASFLYATDLHNNKIDVFDTHFTKPAAMQGKFIDPNIPTGFVPFGIAALSSELYVTYVMRDPALHEEVTGAGFGYVDKFDFNGNFISRFASAGALNAPWGIAVAPAGFGSFEGDLLIGNFGDGAINIFAPDGTSLGPLTVNNGGTLGIMAYSSRPNARSR